MKYTVIGDEAILELTRDDLRALLAKLDDDTDCTMVTHDDNAAWKVIEVVAVEDDCWPEFDPSRTIKCRAIQPSPAECSACGVELSADNACWWCDNGPEPESDVPHVDRGE